MHVLERARHGLCGTGQHLRELFGLLHRRLDAVEAERVGRLLGVVDDVVERADQVVHVARVEADAARRGGEAVDHVVRDPVALLLAEKDLARQLGVLREVTDQVAQQSGRAAHVAAGLLQQLEQPRVRRPSPSEPHTPDRSSAAVSSNDSGAASAVGGEAISGSSRSVSGSKR